MVDGSVTTSFAERRAQSPVSVDLILDRIEVVRHFGGSADEAMQWDVYLYPIPDNDKKSGPNFLLVGHLFRSCDEGHAQVRTNAFLRAYEENGESMAVEFVRDRMAYGFVEPTYDACRRALEMQAANMDIDLELPRQSPVTTIKLEQIRSKSKKRRPKASVQGT
jgi:hypothetical protein